MDFVNFTRRRFMSTALAGTAAGQIANLALPGSALAQGTPTKGGVLRASIGVRPTTMNPLKGPGSMDYLVSELLYSGLTKVDTKLNAIPEVATSWTGNADSTEFTFKLRQGIKFAHGKELTSEDVVATMKAVLDPKTASPAMTGIGPVQDVVATDPYTVVFKLSRPFIDLPVALAHPNARIVPADIVAKDVNLLSTTDYGSGPFRLVEYDAARIIRVKRNPNYLDGTKPYLDGIVLPFYPDNVAEVGAMLNGENDIQLVVNSADYQRVSGSAGVKGVRRATGGFMSMTLRMDTKPFNDARVRQALALTLDRGAMVDLVLNGYGRPAYDSFISQEYQFFHDTGTFKPDIAKAKALLAAAGYPNGLKVTMFAARNPPERTQLGVAVKEMSAPAGFDIDVQTIPMDNFIANVWRKANFYVGNWQMQPTQDAQYTKLLTTHAGLADTAWNNTQFDDLVVQGEAVSGNDARGKVYTGTQELMAKEQPYIVPFFKDALSAAHSYVNGYIVHPLVQPNFLEDVWLGSGAPTRTL